MKKMIIIAGLVAANLAMFAQIIQLPTSEVEVAVEKTAALSETIDSLSVDVLEVDVVSSVDTLSAEGAQNGVKCLTGGPGAMSCSISRDEFVNMAGCSVTCEAGSYACCSTKGCHCLPNKKDAR